MNIIVKPYGSGRCHCRPDTTWERENKDFYTPECVRSLYWAPIVFARICKAGKCIGDKFASRYYDAVGFGAMLYTDCEDFPDTDIQQSVPADIAAASCTDHTSILPFPLLNPAVLESAEPETENMYVVQKDGETSFSTSSSSGQLSLIQAAICEASALTSLRVGDFIAVELAPTAFLTDRDVHPVSFKGNFGENVLFDFKIIF